jgi:pantetheine-phosphate adenylyltransferase
MATDPKYTMLRSSTIKEIASFQGDVSMMVPPFIADALKKKFASREKKLKKNDLS